MKWKYLKVPAREIAEVDSVSVEKLNKFGENGWELCYVTNWNGRAAFFYFKKMEK